MKKVQAQPKPPKAVAIVLARIFEKEGQWTIRVVIPGIDRGSAVWLETKCERKTLAEVETLAKLIVEKLRAAEFQSD